ncbi:hypothetical protein CROQUDRAFT_666096 [Cronartium quercuum f. sp. fusiforme G11]|uniref:COP9 signalosome complex subunit 6 n=1 Tax=Cronartium quercuum f. sp. fusiforme G11 TaxID=708437 RepID=A0A9P6T6S4_9BASI|nr:hypothetical protein CROQUDRAFT_666096 [Cronartium quercuum f. sp. fusiforme G11]
MEPTTTLVNNAILSDLEISLHPLPILNISDHFTRTRLQSRCDSTPIYGALIGTQVARKIEIVNSFELLIQEGQVDHGFMTTRQEQFKQVFPTLDLLGWYTVGHQPEPAHLLIQEQLTPDAESTSPLLLLYSSSSVKATTEAGPAASKELPVDLFEFVGHEHNTAGGADSSRSPPYVKCNYAVETSEAERIAVDYVAKPNVGSKESALVANLTTQRNAIKMLHSRLQVILKYLDTVVESCLAEGDIDQTTAKFQPDHEALRQISSLIACLPNARENKPFMKEYVTEYDDALLTSYLSTQTKTLNETNQLIDKYIYLVARERDIDSKEHHGHGHSSRYGTRGMQKMGDSIGPSKRGGGRMH